MDEFLVRQQIKLCRGRPAEKWKPCDYFVDLKDRDFSKFALEERYPSLGIDLPKNHFYLDRGAKGQLCHADRCSCMSTRVAKNIAY